jgi:hypothetical protein
MSDESSAPSSPSGEAGLEKAAGFKPMPTQDGAPPKPKREFESAREAGEALKDKRRRTSSPNPIQEIAYRNRDGSIADESETVTLNRAADDRKAQLDQRAEMAAAVETFDTQDKIDAHRTENADVISAGPHTEPNQPQLEQDPAADQFEQDAIASGVSPALAKVLRDPQARQALEGEFAKVGKLQAEHTTNVEIAQHFARDAWISNYPEIANLRPEQIGPALARLKQTNPQRFNAAMSAVRRVNEAVTVSQQHQQQRVQVEQQNFDRDAKQQDAIFERSIQHETPQKRATMAREVVSYAAEMGIDQATLTNLFRTNPVMRNAAMQRVFWDAASARAARREGMTYRDKLDRTVPPVQRPGHSNSPRSNRGNENLAALTQKANKSGSLKDMAALLAASRRGR